MASPTFALGAAAGPAVDDDIDPADCAAHLELDGLDRDDQAVHLRRVDVRRARVVIILPSGLPYCINKFMSRSQLDRLDELTADLGDKDELDLNELVIKRPGRPDELLHDNDQGIQELRDITQKSLKWHTYPWKRYVEGLRSDSSAPPPFPRKSPRLAELHHMTQPEINTPFFAAAPADRRKLTRRIIAVRDLHDFAQAALGRLHPHAAPLEAQGRSKQIATVRELLTPDKRKPATRFQREHHGDWEKGKVDLFALEFEAMHPLPDNPTPDQIRAKRQAALAMIQARGEAPSPAWYDPFKIKPDATEEAEYADELALAGFDTRESYRAARNALTGQFAPGEPVHPAPAEKRVTPEFFFMRLSTLVADDATDAQIEELMNGPHFKTAFGLLHPEEQTAMRDHLIQHAKNMRDTLVRRFPV